MEEIIEAPTAFDRHARIVELRNRAETTFLELGEQLYWFEEHKQYENLGHPTFNSYLADPDVDISRTTAFKLKGIYHTYVFELKVPPAGLLPAGYDKLDTVRPYVTEENVEEWVNKAATLSRSDLRKEIRDTTADIEVPTWDEDEEWAAVVKNVSDYYFDPYAQVRWRLEVCQTFMDIAKKKDGV